MAGTIGRDQRRFSLETGDFSAPLEAVLDHRSLPLTVAYSYMAGTIYAPLRPTTGETGFYLGKHRRRSFT